jgi:hypothetical protein
MSSSKKLSCKGTLRQVFIEEIHLVMTAFLTQLYEMLPLILLSGSTLSLSPLLCVKIQYIQTVRGWEGVEDVESCRKPYSARGEVTY